MEERKERQIEKFLFKVVGVNVRNGFNFITVARCVELETRERFEVYLNDAAMQHAAVDACLTRRPVVVEGKLYDDDPDEYPVVDYLVSFRRAKRSELPARA